MSGPEIHVLALDPGVTTGYAFGTIKDNTLYVDYAQGELILTEIYELLEYALDKDWLVVYETFEYRNQPRTGLNLTPVRIIGIIELFREWHGAEKFFPQSAAMGKAFYSDDKLKDLGLYKKGLRHGRDATRHLLRWAHYGAGGQYWRSQHGEHVLIESDIKIGDTLPRRGR